jgi:ABC-type transporter Mla MlaB component
MKINATLFSTLAFIFILGCTPESEPGPEGLVSLFKLTQEPAGVNCASGGFKIETGIDSNRNSILDIDEIQSFAFICNGTTGATGSSGTNGLVSLIKVSTEPVGSNCITSGNRVDTGIDDNNNGVLDPTEIDTTFYICNGNVVNYGKHTLVLSGDLTDEEAAEIVARDLGSATQEIKIVGCTNLTTVDLSRLKSALLIDIFENPHLKTINLSGLKTIIGTLRIENLPELQELNFDSLQQFIIIDSEFSPIISNVSLEQLSFPNLIKVENFLSNTLLWIENTALTAISFPELKKGQIQILNNPDLVSVSMPELVTGQILLSGQFSELSLPEFTEGSVHVAGPNLESVALPKFLLGEFSANDSPLLTVSLPEFTTGNIIVLQIGSIPISLPKFATGSFYADGTLLNEIVLPEFSDGPLFISNNSALETIKLAKFTSPKYLDINNNSLLTTIAFPTFGTVSNPISFVIMDGQLSSSDINSILANLVQITPAITAGYIGLSGMIPLAPPTGQGVIDKNILIANGISVHTD